MKFVHALVAVMATGGVVCAAPPVSTFMSYPKMQSVKISPTGKYLALTARTGETELITVLNTADAKIVASDSFGKDMGIELFEWANDTRLLIQPARRFVGTTAYFAPTGEIIVLDVEKRKSDLLFSYRKGGQGLSTLTRERATGRVNARIVDLTPNDPDTVLIQTRSYEYEGDSNSLQRLNIRNGNLTRIAGSPVQEANYITSTKNEPLFVTGFNAKGELQTYQFKPEDKTWRLLTTRARRTGYIWPFEDTANPDEFLALDSVSTPNTSLISWNPATDERHVLFKPGIGELGIAGLDADSKVWSYVYDDHTPQYWYPDPEHPLARAHRALRATFKDANISFTSMTRDMSLAIAEVSAPRIPPTFYLMDVKALKFLQKMPSRPDLKPEDLSQTDPFEVTVRDGTKIRGFITMPVGTNGKSLPMIVVVHGGPHGPYDRYDFDEEIQLLASRGYAVLQVNFRGSGGRGLEFEKSGYGKWGREMQDDITDAVKWVIGAGIADRERICIYGASYGGFAALTGIYREPDMFKCAIGMAGVYDLPLMFDKGDIQTLERGVNYLREAVGTDAEDMRERSPVSHADKMKAAVMLIHGKDDERAPFEHALRMRAALTKAGKPPEWISEGREGHGIFDEASRTQVYEKMLDFFGKHIGLPPTTSAKN
jgi:dipeptidyl aminopeptidase/acylaminoacyl peptidase